MSTRRLLPLARDASARPWTFYVLAAFFAAYVLFLYGPMLCMYVLSFQGEQGALSFPMRGLSLHWFHQLRDGRTADIGGAVARSIPLALVVMVITVVFSVAAGLGFRSLSPPWTPTWRAASIFAIPIDQALGTAPLVITRRSVGPDLGSDHRPLNISVGWAR